VKRSKKHKMHYHHNANYYNIAIQKILEQFFSHFLVPAEVEEVRTPCKKRSLSEMKHAANAFSVSNLEDICEMPRLLVRVKSLKVLSMLFVNIRGVLAQLTSQPEPMALLFVLISSLRNDVVNALNKQRRFWQEDAHIPFTERLKIHS